MPNDVSAPGNWLTTVGPSAPLAALGWAAAVVADGACTISVFSTHAGGGQHGDRQGRGHQPASAVVRAHRSPGRAVVSPPDVPRFGRLTLTLFTWRPGSASGPGRGTGSHSRVTDPKSVRTDPVGTVG